MLYLYSLILGIVQGITEFLPVSSSGHLVVLHDILKMNLSSNLAFDVSLHFGTLLALLIYFRVEILKYLAAIIEIFIPKRAVNKADLSDIMLIVYASIPAAIVGAVFGEAIGNYFRRSLVVAVTLIIGAILMFLAEKYCRSDHDFTGMGILKAVYVGLAQVLALIPGVSRSGITIVAGMSVKLKRVEAAKFSFLLSMPVIFGAGIFNFFDIDWALLPPTELVMFALGFISSFVVGFFVIKYFLKFLNNHSLNSFAWYRIGLAGLIIIWLLAK